MVDVETPQRAARSDCRQPSRMRMRRTVAPNRRSSIAASLICGPYPPGIDATTSLATWPSCRPQTVGLGGTRPPSATERSSRTIRPAKTPETAQSVARPCPTVHRREFGPVAARPPGGKRNSTTEHMFCTMTVDNPRRPVHNYLKRRGQPARNRGRTRRKRGPSVDEPESRSKTTSCGATPRATTTSCGLGLDWPLSQAYI